MFTKAIKVSEAKYGLLDKRVQGVPKFMGQKCELFHCYTHTSLSFISSFFFFHQKSLVYHFLYKSLQTLQIYPFRVETVVNSTTEFTTHVCTLYEMYLP